MTSTSAHLDGEQALPTPTRVGVVGVGAIGAGMCAAILNAGYHLTVYDVRPEAMAPLVSRGAHAAATLTELAAASEVVFVVVVGDELVTRVVDELCSGARSGSVLVISSTARPETCIGLEEVAARVGASIVDAPVSGGGGGEAAGRLTLLIGGADHAVSWCRPVLEVVGSRLFHLGPVGAGSAGKLVNNLLSLGTYALQLEAMQLADAYGISEDQATTFLTASGGDSRGIRSWGRLDRIRAESGGPSGVPPMRALAEKDVRAAAMAAGTRGVVLPLAAVIGELIGSKMAERDRLVANRGRSEIDRCAACGQELALPFRVGGIHPECAAG
ncbi:MAG: NAD(P)-dependent oxidoreductase [Aeromicrobium sp.]|nr:NAD(P)-dependent oxidoreductase [Aeromicrobium sp.]